MSSKKGQYSYTGGGSPRRSTILFEAGGRTAIRGEGKIVYYQKVKCAREHHGGYQKRHFPPLVCHEGGQGRAENWRHSQPNISKRKEQKKSKNGRAVSTKAGRGTNKRVKKKKRTFKTVLKRKYYTKVKEKKGWRRGTFFSLTCRLGRPLKHPKV